MDKKLAKNYVIYVLLGFLAPALNFFLIPIYTRTLTKVDFGIIALSMVIQALFQTIIGSGINSAYRRFYFEYKEKNQVASLFFTAILTLCITMVVWLSIMLLTGDWILGKVFSNDEFTFLKYGWISLVLAALTNMYQVILSKYRNEENAVVYAVMAISTFLVPAALIFVGVVVLKGGALYSLLGRMIGMSGVIGIYFIYFLFKYQYAYQFKYIKVMLSYSRNILVYSLLTFMFQNVDKYLIERNFTLSDLGMYGLALSVIAVIEIFGVAMSNAVKPRIYMLLKLESSPDNEQKLRALNRVILVSLSAVWFGLLLLFPFANKYLLSNLYPDLAYYFPVMVLAMLARIYYLAFVEPIFFYMQTHLLPRITLFSFIISVTGSLILIPVLGIWAVMIMSIVTQVSQLSLIIILSKAKGILSPAIFRFPKEYLISAYGIPVAILQSLVYFYLPLSTAYVFSAIVIAVTFVLYIIVYSSDIKVAIPALRKLLNK
jgi:O-antigen/teichoic acid export membrane protein